MKTGPHYNDCMCDGCMVKYYNQGLIYEGTPAYKDVMDILKNRKTKVIAGFPGVGKSILAKSSHYVVLDSDSSKFSWLKNDERHPNFPNNYIKYIKENIGKADCILVSSHDIVRKTLQENGIEYTLVYPSRELKSEYLERYRNRGNDDKFISFVDSNWDKFIDDIENETFPNLVKLESGEFLADIV